jgi:hypothetical protein
MRVAFGLPSVRVHAEVYHALQIQLRLVLFRIDVLRDHVDVIGGAESLASFSTSAVLPEPTGPVHVCFSV